MLFSKKKKIFKYSDLSSRDQKSILRQSVQKANKEQLNVVEEFDRRFSVKHAN
jgi:hypothetical protein